MLCRRILMGLSWLVSNAYPSSRVHVQRTAVGLPHALDVTSRLLAWPPLTLPSALCRAVFFLDVSGPSRRIARIPVIPSALNVCWLRLTLRIFAAKTSRQSP